MVMSPRVYLSVISLICLLLLRNVYSYPGSISSCFTERFKLPESKLVELGVEYIRSFIDKDDPGNVKHGFPFQEYEESFIPTLNAFGIKNPTLSDLADAISNGDIGDYWMMFVLPGALNCHLVMTRIFDQTEQQITHGDGTTTLYVDSPTGPDGSTRSLGANAVLLIQPTSCFIHFYVDDSRADGGVCMRPEEMAVAYPEFQNVREFSHTFLHYSTS
jgi:hypothetical protein